MMHTASCRGGRHRRTPTCCVLGNSRMSAFFLEARQKEQTLAPSDHLLPTRLNYKMVGSGTLSRVASTLQRRHVLLNASASTMRRSIMSFALQKRITEKPTYYCCAACAAAASSLKKYPLSLSLAERENRCSRYAKQMPNAVSHQALLCNGSPSLLLWCVDPTTDTQYRLPTPHQGDHACPIPHDDIGQHQQLEKGDWR